MIVELYGLPGAGKTTLTKKLCQSGFVQSVILSKSELVAWTLVYFLLHPIKAFRQLWSLGRHSVSFKMFYFKLMNIFMHRNARFQKARWMKASKIVIDEGSLQNVISLFETQVDEPIMRSYIRTLNIPDVLVVISASTEINRSRIKERGYEGRRAFGDAYAEQWVETILKNHEQFLKIVPSLPCKKIFSEGRDDSVIEKISI